MIIQKRFIIDATKGNALYLLNKAKSHGWKVSWVGEHKICLVKYQ